MYAYCLNYCSMFILPMKSTAWGNKKKRVAYTMCSVTTCKYRSIYWQILWTGQDLQKWLLKIFKKFWTNIKDELSSNLEQWTLFFLIKISRLSLNTYFSTYLQTTWIDWKILIFAINTFGNKSAQTDFISKGPVPKDSSFAKINDKMPKKKPE